MREGRARSGTGSCCLASAALAALSSWLVRLPALAASRGTAARGPPAAGRAAPGPGRLSGSAARLGGPRARVRRRYEEPDDALDRLDIQDGGREVGFSKKHGHLTYEEALEQEPGFCNWVLRESQKEDASERLMDFAQWLQEQGVSHFNDGLVGFGKHARLTYEEALEQEPGFCNWVLRESQKEDASERLTDFAQWLQEQGVSPMSSGLVGFGRLADLTYEEALDQDPGFCDWVLRESQKGDASGMVMDFARWLKEQGGSHVNDGVVGFGKHARLTYQEALEQEPGFCNWVLRESQTGDASKRLMDFAQWLQEQGVSHISGLVGFGRLADLTYEEALDQDPGFCDWVLRESQKGDASGMVMDFARWLKERGVELEHSER